jgi:glycosyltransferase involved in cell wall biosynthesis
MDNPLLFRLRKKAYGKILKSCQGMVAVSEEVRTSLVRDLGAGPAAAEKITVVTNAVEIPLPLDTARRDAIRDDLEVGPGQTLILAAGRFCEQKNFGDLVTAMARLKESGCPFRLVIAGDGEQRAELADRVGRLGLESEVALPGNLTDLDKILQAADIFVMSSLWEGLPLVLLEAMAAGLPVVAYGIPGIEEVVADGATGLIVPVGEPVSLADGLERLAGDGELRGRLGAAGETRIRTEYSFAEYVEKLSGLYRRAATEWKGTEP